MNKYAEWYEHRKGTLAGCGLGLALAALFVGQSYREIGRFGVDPADPSTRVCLGLTQQECVQQVTKNASESKSALGAQKVANRIANRQRRRRESSTTRSTSSPRTTTTAPTPTVSTPTSPPTHTPTPSPPITDSPSTSGSHRRPASPPPASSAPRPQNPPPATKTTPSTPPASTTPTGPSTTSAPQSTTPTVPALPPVEAPPVSVPVPPVPVQVCTPFVGVNCPTGSVQAQRTSNRGPGTSVDPVKSGSSPNNYDVDPNTPSDIVNVAPNPDGGGGEGK